MKCLAGRRATQDDFHKMLGLPESPGTTEMGERVLAFCYPNHTSETLRAYFSAFPEGIFVSEENGQVISFACAIRGQDALIAESTGWSEFAGENEDIENHSEGDWLYVNRLAYTAGPDHADLVQEIGPLLVSLQEMAIELKLKGVAFPSRFHGFRERSGTTDFQRSIIGSPDSMPPSGIGESARDPIGIASYVGFRHEAALPNYLGDGRHFALMLWKNPQTGRSQE